MTTRTGLALVLLGAAFLAGAAERPGGDGTATVDRLQGGWTFDAARCAGGGAEVCALFADLAELVVQGDKVFLRAVTPEGGTVEVGTFRETAPGAVDLRLNPELLGFQDAGPLPVRGSYSLAGDTLRICFARPDGFPAGLRPRGMTALTLKRRGR